MWNYSNISVETTLTGTVTAGDTAIPIASTAGLPVTFPYTVVLDYGQAAAEVVTVTNLTGSTLTVTRGQDGTTAQSHNLGAKVVHAVVARDLREPQQHIAASGDVHGIGGASNVVGTATVQTLTGKTISGAANTLTNIPAANLTGTARDLVTEASGVNAVPLKVKAVNGQVADRQRWEDHLGSSPTRVNAAGELVAAQLRTPGTVNVDGNLTATGNLTGVGLNASGEVVVTRGGATDLAYRAAVTGDTNARLVARADGRLLWGPGNATDDVNLYRSGANTLKTDDAFEAASVTATGAGTFGGGLAVTGNASVTGNLTVSGIGQLLAAHKSATTSRNNAGTGTTLTADPHLSVNPTVNGVYLVELSVAWTAGVTPDLKFDFALAAGATFDRYRVVIQGTSAIWTDIVANASTPYFLSANGNDQALLVSGTLIMGGAGGAFTWRWAQNTADAANTTVYLGSWMRLLRIA